MKLPILLIFLLTFLFIACADNDVHIDDACCGGKHVSEGDFLPWLHEIQVDLECPRDERPAITWIELPAPEGGPEPEEPLDSWTRSIVHGYEVVFECISATN